MNILIDMPDELLVWIDRKRKLEGIPSRRKALVEAARIWSEAPVIEKPKESDTWQEEIATGMCPECAKGQHCHAVTAPYVFDDHSKRHLKIKIAYVCACKVCVDEEQARAAV